LQRNKFCNIFRVLDRMTQWIIKNVIEKGSQNPIDVVFRVVVFQLFSRVETYEALEKKLGPLTWKRYTRTAYERVLRSRYENQPLYTAAYQKYPPRPYGYEDFVNSLAFLEDLMQCDLLGRLQNASYIEDVFDWLHGFPGMGDFSAYQLLLTLSYTEVLNFSESDFVIAGCGARSGLRKMFPGIQLPSMEINVIRWMAETQDQHFARLGLTFNGLGPDRIPMQLADIEHTLCEVDKYARFAHPSIRSAVGKTSTRVTLFSPSVHHLPNVPNFPKAWSHPDRKIVRIRPGGPIKATQRYVVEKLVDHVEEDGILYYHIHWEGYPVAKRTWEPAEAIMEDAPGKVEEYNAHLKKSSKKKKRRT
jgi:hypothetical protein